MTTSKRPNNISYKSIGWVYNAIWIPHEKITETKVILPTKEEFKAVLGKSIHYKFRKHPEVKEQFDAGNPLNLLVYPYTNFRGEIAKFLINGMYLPKIKPEEELSSLFGDLVIGEGTTGFFLIQGRLVDHEPNKNKIGIKIFRNIKAKPKKKTYPEWKGFKNTIIGTLPDSNTKPGDFWELLCELQGNKLVLIDAKLLKTYTGDRVYGNPNKRYLYQPKPAKKKSPDVFIRRKLPDSHKPKKLDIRNIKVC